MGPEIDPADGQLMRKTVWNRMANRKKLQLPPGFKDMTSFSLVEALLIVRRSRRFYLGLNSQRRFCLHLQASPMPLSELEKLLVVMA